MLNNFINKISFKFHKQTLTINESKFRSIKSFLVGTVIISGIQGINIPKVLAFEIIPLEAVSTSLTSHEYLGLGRSSDTFSVAVSNYPGLNPMAQLWGFTLSLTPPQGGPPAPPYPQIFFTGTPSGWQLSETGRIPSNYCGIGWGGSYDYCALISIPTLTFNATDFSTAIFPGNSLGGFSLEYSNGCGVYCGSAPSKLSVIAVSSVPEPITILGSAIALGFGIALKRKLAKPNSKCN